MAEMNVTVEVRVEVMPWGHGHAESYFAHPSREAEADLPADKATPVLPLTSSVLTPGYARAL